MHGILLSIAAITIREEGPRIDIALSLPPFLTNTESESETIPAEISRDSIGRRSLYFFAGFKAPGQPGRVSLGFRREI